MTSGGSNTRCVVLKSEPHDIHNVPGTDVGHPNLPPVVASACHVRIRLSAVRLDNSEYSTGYDRKGRVDGCRLLCSALSKHIMSVDGIGLRAKQKLLGYWYIYLRCPSTCWPARIVVCVFVVGGKEENERRTRETFPCTLLR